ncbi:CoA pyrophosphatase [bacterium]|nr:CoA pyrophosphatase [candidate division CSSED10-310 bacterium]
MNLQTLQRCLTSNSPYPVTTGGVRDAAVMVLIQAYHGVWHFVLIARSHRLELHAGETAFPGGRRDSEDRTPEDTAVREVAEEIGVPAQTMKILGTLPLIMTLGSGFTVYPVVAVLDPDFDGFIPNPDEVDSVFRVPISMFDTHPVVLGPEHYFLRGYRIDGRVIWGATGKIIRKFLDCVSSSPGA